MKIWKIMHKYWKNWKNSLQITPQSNRKSVQNWKYPRNRRFMGGNPGLTIFRKSEPEFAL